jgi:ankyrin repeat protein
VNVQNHDGMTPLALATANGQSEVVELLEAREARARWGVRAPARLSDVSGAGVVAEAETLLDEETGPNVTGSMGLTPLAAAALGYQPETAKLLIERGADVNMPSGGTTPLHFAAMAASVEVAEVLLAHGADVNVSDGHGVTPLSLAEGCGVSEMVILLEEHGGEVGWGDQPWAPMFEAVGRRDAAAVEALLARGADPSERGIRWVTPLHLAVTIQSPDMVRLLVEHGANPNAATTRGLPRSQTRPDSIANHAASKPGATPLHIAVCEGNAEMVGLLLDGGADVNQENGVGETPLAMAVARGHEDIIRLLKEKGGLEHAPLPKPEPESGPPRI